MLLINGKGSVIEGRHAIEPTAFFILGRSKEVQLFAAIFDRRKLHANQGKRSTALLSGLFQQRREQGIKMDFEIGRLRQTFARAGV